MLTSYQRELLLQGEREIDERLLKGLRLQERLIFEAFYHTHPGFAGRLVRWEPGANPPDILCIDGEGKRIGVELAEWLNEEQMKSSKIRERMEDSFMEAVQSKEIPPPSNFGPIWLSVKSLKPLRRADAEAFRKELLSLVKSVDSDWEKNEDYQSPGGYIHQDFSGYPYLDRYLGSLHFKPRSVLEGVPWIVFPNHGGAYTPQDAIDALNKVLNKKTSKYDDLHRQESLDELYLLIYYDQGWFYNTPFAAPGFGFSEIAQIAAQVAESNYGKFQKIFLFNSLYGDQEAAQLWPI